MNARVLSLILILLNLGAAAAGQTSWKSFSPEIEAFTVEIPTELRLIGGHTARDSRKYYAESGGVYFYLFSDPVRAQYHPSEIKRFVAESGATLPEASTSSRLRFTDRYGYSNDIVVIRTDARVYIAQTVSRNSDSEEAQRFLSTFAVQGGMSAVPPVQKTNPASSDIEVQPTRGEAGGGMGAGAGPDRLEISKQPPVEFPQSPPAGAISGVTAPLKILSKPRIQYTEWARFYQVSGKILLRVTFSANGQIGTVAPVSTLPFGMTEQAIKSARAITFEPAYKDGKAITTTKTMEFSFAIY